MSLIKEFESKKKVYIKNKRQYSKKSSYERELKVKKFLKFCENLGVEKIKDINQSHYRQFVEQILNEKSIETKRKYLYALKEFFERAHVDIRINITINVLRTKYKKLKKICEILDLYEESITEEQKNKIFQIL